MYTDRQNSLGRDYSRLEDRERHAQALELVDKVGDPRALAWAGSA